ncbi:hypothetical protein SAMD00019534_019800 [Acytostelium subglobosum LB1]|uniref:hypothetical protein n=1 Tax=Acytostelium subglobosum LB1 TaxID=1410327 RepID=UPI00064487BD|nr:hypothetical protein SAMD00019534_019800 [Acytostelium subglobosum LB1]GAM18805.1 hypothetical protein SAMD00019534_019800 [Acytostelium subglobosum LB1]|eukprot:XP_012758025.1 hypothetical protein SAMD00019534_019800 [Acytostelium subglobosum LB1]
MFQTKVQDIIYPVQSGIWEFLPEMEDVFQDCMDDESLPPVIETEAIDSGGRAFDVEVRTNKATYAGKPVDVFSIIDITGRKNLIEADVALRKAEAANEAKVVFLTTISHELKTPINGIMASCEILERTQIDSNQKEFLDAIKLSSDYLFSLVVDILDYSKMEAGKMELILKDFSLLKLLEDSLSMVSKSAAAKHLDLVLFIDGNVPVLYHGDATRVRQILLNLLSNAIKFTDIGQIKIRVDLERENEDTHEYMLRFEVEDSGIGIKNDHIPLLFTPFSQIDNSNSRRYQGTGLGLSISKRLCNMMDGEVSVSSEFGTGTTFAFTLKLASCVSKPNFTFKRMGGAIYLGEDLAGHTTPLVGERKFGKRSSVVSIVVERNEWVRKSIVHYFALMSISCKDFASSAELGEFLESQAKSNQVYIIIVGDRCNMINRARTIATAQQQEVHWVQLTVDATPNKDDTYEYVIQKPCKFTDIVKCLYQVENNSFDFFHEWLNVRTHLYDVGNVCRPLQSPVFTHISEKSESVDGSPTFSPYIYSRNQSPSPRHSLMIPRPMSLSSDALSLFIPTSAREFARSKELLSTSLQATLPTIADEDYGEMPAVSTAWPYDKEVVDKKVSREMPTEVGAALSSSSINVVPASSSRSRSGSINEQQQPSLASSVVAPVAASAVPPPVPAVSRHVSTAAAAVAPAPVAAPKPAAPSPQPKPGLILLVEDNPINVKVFSKFLNMGGYSYKLAANGLEAVDAVQKYDFDVILMDCQMPLMDGFQATKAIRELESVGKINPPPLKKSPHLIIIALTANNEDRQKCLNVGMDDFLPKPASSALVIEAIQRYLQAPTSGSGSGSGNGNGTRHKKVAAPPTPTPTPATTSAQPSTSTSTTTTTTTEQT